MKTIYNTYVIMESQEQCDRMKQLCIDNGLPIWRAKTAFNYYANVIETFCYSSTREGCGDFALYSLLFDKTQVTEQEFIELLKTK